MIVSDICIAGAGIIGLSLALELDARGIRVLFVESGEPMRQASTAAAGMLAADDPHNPPELSVLAHLSLSLYPSYLGRIAGLSGLTVPFQTSRTIQALPGNSALTLPLDLRAELLLDGLEELALKSSSDFVSLHEHSIDPRQLGPALTAAVTAASIRNLYGSPVVATRSTANSVSIQTSKEKIAAAHFVDCTGAWSNSHDPASLIKATPIKGQMLSLGLSKDLPLKTVLRTEDIYIVPRTLGPNAGRVIVGATIEDIGFDKSVHPGDIERLRQRAISLIPDLVHARVVETWAGLRPASADRLPLIGSYPTRPNHWLATGHYRNGILLAPATARVMAQLILGAQTSVAIGHLAPARFMDPEYKSVRRSIEIAQPRRYSRTP